MTNVFLASFSMLFLLVSCVKEDCTRVMTFTKHHPVYKTYDEIRVDPVLEGARSLEKPGKIYLYGSLILVNEIDEGVHIIDNANPSAPNNIAFIAIPGNVDIAMQGNIMYADNYTDLLAIDISDINNIRLEKRVEDAFPNYGSDPQNGVLVKYIQEEVTEEVKCDDASAWGGGPQVFDQGLATTNNTGGGVAASAGATGREAVGLGGSMARFAVYGNNLYVVDNQDMHIFDIATAGNPSKVNQVQIGWGWGIETIFPHEDKLFIGSNTGMFIYDNSNPSNPTYMSEFQHADACDPVFVDGDFAYVTLRSGTLCQNFTNQLDVIDITNLNNPSLVSTTQMSNPHGLTVADEKLYLCEGDEGLKVFDVSNKQTIAENQLFHDNSLTTYDIIKVPNANRLLVVGKGGFYQYNSDNPADLKLLSQIVVED